MATVKMHCAGVCALIGFALLMRGAVEAQERPPVRTRVEFVFSDVDGTPLQGRLKAHLYSRDGKPGTGVWSDEAGVARWDNLAIGRYDLWAEGTSDSVTSWLANALFRNLEVIPGDGTLRLSLKLPLAGTVKGRLLQADGETPAQSWVVAVQSGTVPAEGADPQQRATAYAPGALSCYSQAEVAADGTFTLTGLTPGLHALDVRRPGEPRAWCSIEDVEVVAGQATDLGAVRAAGIGWRHLLDPDLREQWKESELYGRREVRFQEDRVVLERGSDMTGIHWTGDLPRVDYEVTLQAMRVEGSDFFCGLTFPVKEDPCTLILGGWGGSVVGLSSLNGYDASENETTQWIRFEQGRWYRIRLRVTGERIQAWLDHRPIIDVELKDKRISIRIEVEPSRPFGIATWRTTGALRDLRLRRLHPVATGNRQ